jgi:LysR family hydrogen peroxide-inducible transcriptional activator
MSLIGVRYFLAICETRGFGTAAKACGVSQPTVTGAVRRLEQIVGGKLLARSKPVKLTPLGVKLRPAFQDLQSAADRVLLKSRRPASALSPSGTLTRKKQ